MKPISLFYSKLEVPQNIVIITHENPDGDALGSSMALCNFLDKMGHKVVVVSPTNWPSFLHWLPNASKKLVSYAKHPTKCDKYFDECNILFCLDLNNIARAKSVKEKIDDITCTKILIDHHPQPKVEDFDFGVSNEHKSSTCEMVYDLILDMGKENVMDVNIATCIYTGIMTDTGNFKYRNTSSRVHRIVGDLIDKGVRHFNVYQNVFENFSENRMRFVGHLLKDNMQIHPYLPIGAIKITKADIAEYEIITGDTEGIVFLPLSIKKVLFVALFSQKEDDTIRCSFRSQNGSIINCNSFARKHFKGGGHFYAAGGTSPYTIDDTISKFFTLAEQFFQENNYLK